MNCNAHSNRRRAPRPKIARGLRAWLGAGLAVAALVAFAPRGVPAQSNPDASGDDASAEADAGDGSSRTGGAVWIFRDVAVDAETERAFRSALEEAVAESRRRHFVSREDLREVVADETPRVPPCMKGLESCPSPRALLFDELHLTATVDLSLERQDGDLVASYRVRDRRGKVSKESDARAGDPESLALTLVRDLFDATGTVRIESTPTGARASIDGEPVGTTPVETRLPVGSHEYRLELAKRGSASGTFRVASGEYLRVPVSLEAKPGQLSVTDAPEGARILVDDEPVGSVGETISVEPGTHELAVQADGYESYRQTFHVDPGESFERSIPLRRKNPLLRDVAADEIALNNYVARLTIDQGLHPTSFLDARATAGGESYEFVGFGRDGRLPADGLVRRTVAPTGLRLDFTYTSRHFGVVLASLSYLAANLERTAFVDRNRRRSTRISTTVTGLRRLQLRPFQVTARQFFGNFVPSLELGTGLTFQWIDLRNVGDLQFLTLRQTEAFWTVGLSGQYFFDANWFGVARYSVQDYFNRGRGVEHVLSLGIGAAYPNLFGFEPEPPEEL